MRSWPRPATKPTGWSATSRRIPRAGPDSPPPSGPGVDTVEHGHWIDAETADLMAESGTILVPTLLVNERNFDFPRAELGGSDAQWRWLEHSREAKWRSLEIARRAGVKIGCGTDAGYMIPHGDMNARELELLVAGGLSPVEAIRSATAVGAERLGIEAGVIAPGRIADLVLVDGDPIADVRVLQEQHRLRVFKAGAEVPGRRVKPGERAAGSAADPPRRASASARSDVHSTKTGATQ